MKSYVDELTDLLQEKMDSVKQLESENAAMEAQHSEDVTEIARLRGEIEQLKALPARVVDAETLKEVISREIQVQINDPLYSENDQHYLCDTSISEIIDSLATPQPDYMGAPNIGNMSNKFIHPR